MRNGASQSYLQLNTNYASVYSDVTLIQIKDFAVDFPQWPGGPV